MLDRNVKEYEILRQEVLEVRNCIRSYLNILVGGSGLGFIAISFLKANQLSPRVSLFLTLSILLTITAIYYILLYKFISHNRFTGYMKLISEELILEKIKKKEYPSNLIGWDVCISQLQNSTKIEHFPQKFWKTKLKFIFISITSTPKNKADTLEIIKNKWQDLNLFAPRVDKKSLLQGLELIFTGIRKKDGTTSWKYPLYITYIVIVFSIILEGISIYFATQSDLDIYYRKYTWKFIVIVSYIIITQFILIFTWIRSISELYKITKGSKTISSFCWKFLQYRILFVNQQGFIPMYCIIEKTNYKLNNENLENNGQTN